MILRLHIEVEFIQKLLVSSHKLCLKEIEIMFLV